MFFRASIDPVPDGSRLTYEWKVSIGNLTDGQGTDQIRVVSDQGGINVTAKVTIKGLPDKCVSTATETAPYALKNRVPTGESYDNTSWDDERARLDNVMVHVNNWPESKAFFYIDIGADESFEKAKERVINMIKHIKWRDNDFDAGRLNFGIRKTEKGHLTTIFVFPHDADLPKCVDGCTLLNGKHLYY
ncbi:MAG: hypothetical protein ABL952_03820 [Pyrinomonadaceae bacterium]